ncbi:hypothetical protein [Limnochorda pilosa]|uniref:Abortive infection protein n=1 Tax=Limnochorda pilosa TaxID=1555112 RepID=A0A0K2SI36_LIMPI|nr:hypothetical protein LIP_0934 [Limnochorda pilosa]
MRGNGIAYDTGFVNAGVSTREHFDPQLVRREMRVIREDLHCNAIRITSGDPNRLKVASGHAAEVGLEVWLSPFTCGLSMDELQALLIDCAEHAERLRRGGAEVVFVTGSELSLFNAGFLPGNTLQERLNLLSDPRRAREVLPELPGRVNDFLRKAVGLVRARFGGPVTYASLPFEGVDWAPFDIISTDAGYRSVDNAPRYRELIRSSVSQGKAQGKPVAITEFGCTTHRDAADLGGRGDTIIEWGDDGRPIGLTGDYARDEAQQARYLCELLDIFNDEGVDTAFVNTFARYDLPHRKDAHKDLDRASYGVVKVLEGRRGHTYPDMDWEPKAAFTALANYYRG